MWLRKSKRIKQPIQLPLWHHDFSDRKVSALQHAGNTYRLYRQPYKGIWIIFWLAPTPEDIKIAQDDFDFTYPDCEVCGKTLFICTCMVELDGILS